MNDLLESDAAFTCTQQAHPVRMLKTACVKRQELARKTVNRRGFVNKWVFEAAPFGIEKCLDCPEGRRILAELEGKTMEATEKEQEFMKTCNKCGKVLLCSPDTKRSGFYRSHTIRDGYENQCKQCKKEKKKESALKPPESREEENHAVPFKVVPRDWPEKKLCDECGKEKSLDEFGKDSLGKTKAKVDPEDIEPSRRGRLVYLDFDQYPELHDLLTQRALMEFRNPEQQAMKMLSDALSRQV
jgi:hypothetical protein